METCYASLKGLPSACTTAAKAKAVAKAVEVAAAQTVAVALEPRSSNMGSTQQGAARFQAA